MKYLLLKLRELLPGKELASTDADAIKQFIEEKLRSHVFDALIIDMSRIRYIDSAGLGALVGAFKLMKERGGSVKLFSPETQVRTVLDVTRMSQVFEVLDDLPPQGELEPGTSLPPRPGPSSGPPGLDPRAGIPARPRRPEPSDAGEATLDEAG